MLETLIKELNDLLARYETLNKQHEEMKTRRKEMWTDDLFEWLHLNEKMWALAVEGESLYNELKRKLDIIKWDRKIELKDEVNEDGKKKYTETTADAVIFKQFEDEDDALWKIRKVYKLILNVKQNIPEYVNIVKMDIKNLTPLQWF
jgi:hypothetical protein